MATEKVKELLHKGTRVLETERLILRPFKEGDEVQIYHNWASDDEVTKYLTWPTHASVEVTKKLVDMWIEEGKDLTTYHWGAQLKASGQLVGSMGVVGGNENRKRCTMGYCLSRAYWGKGLTTEALKAMNEFLIKEVGYERVEAYHDVENIASGKVMEKAGMCYEGTLRRYSPRGDGKLYDVKMYSLLKEEI